MTTSQEDRAVPHLLVAEANRQAARDANFDNIEAWQRETFGVPTPADIALRMLGEAVELCQKAGASPYDIQSEVDTELTRANTRHPLPYDKEGVLGELADLMIFLVANTWANGLTEDEVEEAIQAKHEVNLDREWNVFKPGIAQHVETVAGDDPGDSNDG